MNVGQPGFFKALNKQIDAQSLDAWKSYLRWHAIHDAAPWLSDAFVQENFNFYRRDAAAAQKELQPRWKRCTELTDQRAGRSSGTGLGEEELSARSQGEHDEAGGRAG